MKKIGIISQRYGIEVNGGAEYHARVLAEKLAKKYSIEVITTCALDYNDWSNHYKKSDNLINNIHINRFKSETKNHKVFRKSRRVISKNTKTQQFLKAIGLYHFLDKKLNLFTPTKEQCNHWLESQGPYCPDLINHLEEKNSDYSCFIFLTYLYYPTAIGMTKVGEKSIFIPTAHDEPLFYTEPYKDLFSVPKFIMYNTSSEKIMVENNYPHCTKNSDIAGVGIENIETTKSIKKLSAKYNYTFDYLLYIGRIEGSKGCDELIEYYNQSKFSKPIKLIFVGKTFFDVTPTENIIFTGFVSEEEKYFLLNNCKALVIPSKYESLSLVTLEAMIHKKIVIANGKCEVLQNHITDSEAGFSYTNQKTFEKTINSLLNLTNKETEILGEKGYKYVSNNYTWDKIIEKFDKAIEFVIDSNK